MATTLTKWNALSLTTRASNKTLREVPERASFDCCGENGVEIRKLASHSRTGRECSTNHQAATRRMVPQVNHSARRNSEVKLQNIAPFAREPMKMHIVCTFNGVCMIKWDIWISSMRTWSQSLCENLILRTRIVSACQRTVSNSSCGLERGLMFH